MGSGDGPGPAVQRGIVKPAQPPTKVIVRVVFRSGEPVPDVGIFAENLRDSDAERAATIKPKFDANGRYTHHLLWEIRADDFADGTPVTTKDKAGNDITVLKRTLDVKVRKDGFGPAPARERPGSRKDFSTFTTAEGRVVRDLLQGFDQRVDVVMMDVRLGKMADPHTTPDWANELLLDTRARALFGDLSRAGATPDFKPAFERLAFLHKVGELTLAKEPQFNGNNLVLPTSRSQRVSLKGPVADMEFINNWGSKATIKVNRVAGQPVAYAFDSKFFRTPDLLNLDLRNAVGLYRLCAQLRARFGATELHHSGIGAGSGGGANCHNIGTAIDFSGLRMPAARLLPVAVDEPFLIYVQEDWANRSVPNQAAMDAAKRAGVPTPPSSGFDALGRRDLNDRPQQWPDTQRSTEFRLDSLVIAPLSATPTPAQTEDFNRRKALLDTARSVFRFVFDFAAVEYSTGAGGSSCSADCFSDGPTPISPRMDTAGSIMHADYPTPDGRNADGSSQKNGRQAHFTHMHIQIGPTTDTSGV
jgi:hypothetical protein